MKPHVLASFALLARLALSQGGGAPPSPPELPAWPQDWGVHRFAPLVDAQGLPVARRVLAGGFVDFDREGNRDVWFMTEVGPGQSQMHALLANTADLGRFWSWGDYASNGLRDAATYRSRVAFDMVVGVDPTTDSLSHHFFSPNSAGPDPRIGGFWGRNPGWVVGLGCYEIETSNHDGDDHDDLLVLSEVAGGGSAVKFFVMAAPFGGLPSPQHVVSLTLPWRVDSLRALDFDGDRRTDAVVHAPGIGVLVLVRGEKAFKLADFFPLTSGLRDLCVGDADGDGRDEPGVVIDGGVILLNGTPTPRVLPNPASVGSINGARIVDIDRNGTADVVATLASGDAVLVHLRQAAGFVAPLVHRPGVAPDPGTGALGQTMLAFDVDRDGDDDVAVQMRDGGFVTLRSRRETLGPLISNVVHEGRFSESYISERVDFTMPPTWSTAGIDSLEVGIYMRHPHQAARPWVLWGHAVLPVPVSQPITASVRLLYLVDLTKLQFLTSAYLYPQGFAVSGDTMLSVHGRVGQRRYQSMLVFHEGRGDENKSTLGVQWRVIAAPPLPRTDAQLLPF